MAFTPIQVVVTGKNPDLSAAGRTVQLTPTAVMVNDGVFISKTPEVATLSPSGTDTITVAANDDADTKPRGTAYLVEDNTGSRPVTYYVIIPSAAPGGTVNLADLPQATQAPTPFMPAGAPGPEGPPGPPGPPGVGLGFGVYTMPASTGVAATDTANWHALVVSAGYTYAATGIGGALIPSGGHPSAAFYFPGGQSTPYVLYGNQVVPDNCRVYSDIGTNLGASGPAVVQLASPNGVSSLFCSAKWLNTGSPTQADSGVRIDNLTIEMGNAAIAAAGCTIGTDGTTIAVPSTANLAPGMLVSDISNVAAWAAAAIASGSTGATISGLTTITVTAPPGTTNATPTAGWRSTGQIVVATSTPGNSITYNYTSKTSTSFTLGTVVSQVGSDTHLAATGGSITGPGDAFYGYGQYLAPGGPTSASNNVGFNGTTLITSIVDSTHITVGVIGAASAYLAGAYGQSVTLQFAPHAIVVLGYRCVAEWITIDNPQGCGFIQSDTTAAMNPCSGPAQEVYLRRISVNYTPTSNLPIPAFNGGATPPGAQIPIGGQHGIWTTHNGASKDNSDSWMSECVVSYSGDVPMNMESAGDWKIYHNHPWHCAGPTMIFARMSGTTIDDTTFDDVFPAAAPASLTYYTLYGTVVGGVLGSGKNAGASVISRNRGHDDESENAANRVYCCLVGPTNTGTATTASVSLLGNSWCQDAPGNGTSTAYQFVGSSLNQLNVFIGASEIGAIGTDIATEPDITGTAANVIVSSGGGSSGLDGIPIVAGAQYNGDGYTLFKETVPATWGHLGHLLLPSLAGIVDGMLVSSATNSSAFPSGAVVTIMDQGIGGITVSPPPAVASTTYSYAATSPAGATIQLANADAAAVRAGHLVTGAGITGPVVISAIGTPGATYTTVTLSPTISGTAQGVIGTLTASSYVFSGDTVTLEGFVQSSVGTVAAERLTANFAGSTVQKLSFVGRNASGPPTWQVAVTTVTNTSTTVNGVTCAGTIVLPANSPYPSSALNVGQPVGDSILLAPTPGVGQIPSGTKILAISGTTIGLDTAPTGTAADVILFSTAGIYLAGDKCYDQATPAMWTTVNGQQSTGLAPVDWYNDWSNPTFSGSVSTNGLRSLGATPTIAVNANAGTARTDTATVTAGSATVTDTSCINGDLGKLVAATGGTGSATIPANTWVGTVSAGASFTLSSVPPSASTFPQSVVAGGSGTYTKVVLSPSATVVGNSLAGTITLVTGISPAQGPQVGITYATALPLTPNAIVLTPMTQLASQTPYYVNAGYGAGGFSIGAKPNLTANSTYVYSYIVMQ